MAILERPLELLALPLLNEFSPSDVDRLFDVRVVVLFLG